MRLSAASLAAALASLALLVVAGAAPDAAAYPQFQLSTDNARCSMCHIAPTGGGLINAYGRSESSDTISQWGGDGSFLYSLYQEPDWLKLGVDFRSMAMARDNGDEIDGAYFPMQGDTYAALILGDFTVYGAVGPRAQVRRPDGVLDRFGAREYWAMWRPEPTGWYARGGRYLAPFGLRSQDHTLYTRRYLGSYIWDETHTVTVGHLAPKSELHVSAFTPIPDALLGGGPREHGGAAFWERRLDDDDTLLVAAQTRLGFGETSRRYTAGGFGKKWWDGPGILVQAELDLTLEDFVAGGSPGRGQLASYLGGSWRPTQGYLVTAAFERFDPDLAIKNLWHDAYTAAFQWFPLAHYELMLEAKVELPGSYGRPQTLVFVQGHYYL